MSITEIMAQARRVVHSTFGENAVYSHRSASGETKISVRWHNRIALRGNISDDGYSDIIEGVNRVFFNKEELALKSIVLQRGGRVTLTDALNNGVVLVLDSQEPDVGPINEIWNISVPTVSS
jgi:hypothetical protein